MMRLLDAERLEARRAMLLGRAFELEAAGHEAHAERVWRAADRVDHALTRRRLAELADGPWAGRIAKTALETAREAVERCT